MTDEYSRPLDEYRGHLYAITVRATPGFNDPRDFSVSLMCRKELGKNEEVVRIDNSHNKGPHVHRLYRRGEPEEPFDGGLWEAIEQLQENWRTYAQSYLQR